MYYFIYPKKDATIYNKYPDLNSGLDEILEISKEIVDTANYNSRILMQFDINDLSQSLSNDALDNSIFSLKLFSSEANYIPYDYTLNIHRILNGWVNGTGLFLDNNIVSDGVTWNNKNQDEAWTVSGSDYSSSVDCYKDYEYESPDININISNLVNYWRSNPLENYGLLIKHPDSEESNNKEYGQLHFFSKETHTLYRPVLETKWDDSVYDTGSLEPVTGSNITLELRGLKKEYNYNTKIRFNVYGRSMFSPKTFDTSYNPNFVTKYLPQTTYYSIVDAYSNREIIPFSDYSKISCDLTGNYFNIYTRCFEVNRFYKIKFKILLNDIEYDVDKNYVFKIIK